MVTKTRFDGDTQKLRRELIVDLLFLKEYTSRRANDRRLKDNNRLKWTQITAEIARTINYIIKDFDKTDIKKRIEELTTLLDTPSFDENRTLWRII